MTVFARLALPLTLLAAVAALPLHAAERQARPVSGFTAIALSAPVKLELVQGDTESLALEGDEAALAEIEAVVEGGTLQIRSRNRKFFNFGAAPKVRGYVTAKNIESLRISGSGDITTAALRANALKLGISGSGDIRIGALGAASLDVSVSGSGDVSVAGKADRIVVGISGSGDVKAGKLETREAKVSIAGSGDIAVWTKESLTVKIAGSGDVRYYGDPAITKSVAGAGSVKRLGPSPS
jgi:hypothetical protein